MQCYWLLVTNITVRFLQYPITITNIHECLPHYPVIQKTNVRNIIDVSLNRIKDYKQWAKYVSPESSWEGLFCPLYEEWSLCCILHQIFQQGTLLLRHHLLQIGPFQYSKWILFFDQVTQKISRLAEKKPLLLFTHLATFRTFICFKSKVDHVCGQVHTKNMSVVCLKQNNFMI